MLVKAQRKMVYGLATTIQSQHPGWTVHTCLEESFIQCAGFNNYNAPLQSMLIEYRENPTGSIEDLMNKLKAKNK